MSWTHYHHHYPGEGAPMTKPTPTPRQRKTAAQRATEALAVAERKVDRYAAELKKHADHLQDAEAQLEAATRRRDFLRQDPDLPATKPAPDGAE